MIRASVLPRNIFWGRLLVLVLVLCWTTVYADDLFVIPIRKEATGYATTDEVLKNRTFSNSYATGLTGTRPYAPVEKTGQASARATGDDGYYKKGIHWPVPRFTAGTYVVTDNLTGLRWQRSVPGGDRLWEEALDYCNGLVIWEPAGIFSIRYDDWRLANIKELLSLIDRGSYGPALPTLDPFNNVQSAYYWSSTSYAPFNSDDRWVVDFTDGSVEHDDKDDEYYRTWCVCGGN